VKRNLAPFILLQFASITSVISGAMVFIAIPWIALEITGTSTAAGLVVSLTAIPGLLLSPVIGSFIDKVGRRNAAGWSELLTVLTSLLIPLFSGFWELTITALIGIGILRAVVAPGGSTARKALVPDVAAAGKLTLDRANSIHEAIFASGFAIGPALATFCIAAMGSANTFLVVAGFGAVSAFFALLIRVTEQHEENDESENQPFYIYAVQGFKILFQTPSVLVLMAAIMTLALIYLPTEMLILPTAYNEMGDPEGLGLVVSAMAFASVFGALFFEQIHKRISYANILRIGILGVPLSMIPMSQLPAQWAMIFFGMILGLVWGPLLPLLNTVIQTKIPANKRGRVFSLEMTVWSAGPMISMVAVGAAVDAVGVKPIYLALSLGVLVAGILVSTNKYIKELDS
jgi:MFS family permease